MHPITISSIELVNFMCHSNLKISFEKAITCIGGRNGSGKSAIMIALGILFGQRAQALERGNSYAGLIKSGTSYAIIKVTINNHLNYRREIYNEFIVIEKRIRVTSTHMSIGNLNGKLFKIGKNELDIIVERYNLKFENPLNFLTQEKSKQLLNTTSSEDLYEFYHVGTELKGTADKLVEGLNTLSEMQSVVKQTIQSLETAEATKAAEEKNLEFLSFDADKALNDLEIEERWGNLLEVQNTINSVEAEIEACEKSLVSKNEERDTYSNILSEQLKEQDTQMLEDAISQLKVQLHDVDGELSDYIQDKRRTSEQMEIMKKGNNKEELRSTILRYEEELSNRKRCYKELEGRRVEAYEAYQHEKSENERKTNHVQNLKRQLNYLTSNSVDKNKKDQLDTFRQIEEEIKKLKFEDRIVGPVCKYITLKEPKWYKAASIILKKSLTNYIVFNHRDKMKLHSLFKRLNVYYSVTQVFKKTAYRDIRTNSEYKTLLSVLQIDDPVVFNQLVTFHSIEQIILIDDRNTAHSVIRGAPRNVDCAYTLVGDKIKLSNGSLSDFRQKDDGIYWFEDNENKIKKIECEIANVKTNSMAENVYNEIMKGLESATAAIESFERRITKLNIELEALNETGGGDVEAIERKHHVLLKSISALEARKVKLMEKMNDANTEKAIIIDNNKKIRSELDNKKTKAREKMFSISNEVMRFETQKAKLNRQKNESLHELDKLADGIEEKPLKIRSKSGIAAARKEIYEFKAQASAMKSKESIALGIEVINKEIARYQNIKEKYELIITETQEICSMLEHKMDEIKDKDTMQTCRLFREYTERSGYCGEMTIDHINKKLDLRMRVHNSDISGSRNTLSGGERSFAGVCFLLSMWKCFKCPVKVLDEFDVFMDPLNRKVAISALLEFFRESKSQVILITPLDTSDLNDTDCDVMILKKRGDS